MKAKLIGTMLTAALLATPVAVQATDGHFLHGVGAINSAMGGAGVAAPTSLLGTYYLNPAGLMAFDGTRVEFGFELFKPSRSVASTFTPASIEGSTTSKSDFVPIPAMAFSVKLNNEKVVLGVGGLSIGGFGVDYPSSTTNPILFPQPNGFGQVYSNYALLKIAPAVSYAVSDKLWLGAAANIDWASLAVQPMPVQAPDVDPATQTAFYQGAAATDGAFGFGFQAGLMYQVNDMIALGASYSSEQWFEEFKWNSTVANPDLPTFGTPTEITFKLNVPAMAAAGVGIQALPNLLIAGDFRYMFYESTPGFKLPDNGQIMNPDGSVNGFGWKNIWAVNTGLQFRPNDWLQLLGGYNYTQNPVPDSLAMYNVPAPAIVQHHITGGIGVNVTRRFNITAAYYKALENSGTGPLIGVDPGTGQPAEFGTVTNTLSEDSFLIQFSFATRGGM
jgi:long-chain fatty acid transport protein